MILVIDGPEKAGKTTLIQNILGITYARGIPARVHAWGPVDPDDRVYSPVLMEDSLSPHVLHIWQRSWASEHVYAKLLNRDRRLREDPWYGEWIHGRAVTAQGMCVMLLAPIPALRERRDDTDLNIDVEKEFVEFRDYAVRFRWRLKMLPNNMSSILPAAYSIMNELESKITHVIPPVYAGPLNAPVIIIGEKRSMNTQPWEWLPFSSRLTTIFGRTFGDAAFRYGWGNAQDTPPAVLSEARVVISCGDVARKWVANYVSPVTHISVPHPSYLYRYNTKKTAVLCNDVARLIKSVCTSYF